MFDEDEAMSELFHFVLDPKEHEIVTKLIKTNVFRSGSCLTDGQD